MDTAAPCKPYVGDDKKPQFFVFITPRSLLTAASRKVETGQISERKHKTTSKYFTFCSPTQRCLSPLHSFKVLSVPLKILSNGVWWILTAGFISVDYYPSQAICKAGHLFDTTLSACLYAYMTVCSFENSCYAQLPSLKLPQTEW